MDPISQQLMMGAAGAGGEKIYVEDVFSTWLYTGNGSTQTITNGIDLAGEGGLVWIKSRSLPQSHYLFDTERGADKGLTSNDTAAQSAGWTPNWFTSFNSSGFTLGPNGLQLNSSTGTYASWTFRKAEKFFDVVTYTGSGGAQLINHNLGSAPGMIIVKRTDAVDDWYVYHRSLGAFKVLRLNTTGAEESSGLYWGVEPTSTQFRVSSYTNASGGTYVAYLFAHDAGGFGDSGDESVVKCGTFTGNTTVNLGWEPQWIIIKPTSTTGDWDIHDNMRGWPVSGDARRLKANLSNAEDGTAQIFPNATGFSTSIGSATYIYIAIRRGPMKTPTDATKVFNANATTTPTGAWTPGFPVDALLQSSLSSAAPYTALRLTGKQAYLRTSSTAAEVTGTDYFTFDGNTNTMSQTLFQGAGNYIRYSFRRAPGFFDVVAYTGTGSVTTVSHNLGVVPELMIVRQRSPNSPRDWWVYHSGIGNTKYLVLNTTAATVTQTGAWNDTTPTASAFTLGTSSTVNQVACTFVAYLFATCPGVSKVFNFTGNGSSQTINCGFASGARFVLLKRTDSTGNWLVADTARGIVSGNDPLLYLNSTAAEITTLDWIDPDSTGFIVNQEATANANVNGATYIGLAIS